MMQLDLQSVEKAIFSTFACVFAPKMLEIGLPRLRMSRSFLQHLSRAAVSRFSRGPVAGNHRQHFFDPTGSNTVDYHPRADRKTRRIEKKKQRFFRSVLFDPMDASL